MGLKRPERALFSAVWPFCGWAGDLVIWGGGNGCVAVFFVPIFKYDSLKFFQISIIWYICSIIETSMAKVIHVHLLHKIDGTK